MWQSKINIWVNNIENKIIWTIIINKIKVYNQFKNKRILNKETVQIDTNKVKIKKLEINKLLNLIHKGIIIQEWLILITFL